MPRRALSQPALVVAGAAAALLAATGSAAPPERPSVLFIIADDLGWHDPGFAGSGIRTPALDGLLTGGAGRTGARLSHYYGQPVCSPSRASILSGRYPLAYGLQTYVIDPAGVDYGLNTNETTLPQLLRDQAGYATAHVGKWHLGMAAWEQTPTARGYDYYRGYYSGGQDYFTHMEGKGFDQHEDDGRNCGANCSRVAWEAAGVYSAHIYANATSAWLARHAATAPQQPFFCVLAFQSVHAPAQVPPSYVQPYADMFPDHPARRTFAGMLAAMDEAVANVTATLAALALLDSTLIVFVADNGGPVFGGDAVGASNWPLRGGKHSLWEGGVRLASVVNAPAGWLGAPTGANVSGLMHHVDWLPTLAEAAGVSPPAGLALHGSSKWGMLTRGEPSDRGEVLLNIDPCQPAGGVDPGAKPGAGNAAIRVGDWKLHVGLTGPPWGWSTRNGSLSDGGAPAPAPAAGGAADPACGAPGQLWPLRNMTIGGLFNVSDAADPWERDDVAASHPDVVAALLARLAVWGTTVATPPYWATATVDPASDPAARNGTWTPWLA